MSDCCKIEAENQQSRRLLMIVLVLNGMMFFTEFWIGWWASSAGLMADSLDMLADAIVYGISLYAVGRGIKHKANAALFNGGFQLSLGILVLLTLTNNAISGAAPIGFWMMLISAFAFIVNLTTFLLLYRFRQGDVNLKASWICSRNDMLANLGVLVSGALVVQLQTAWPDYAIGAIIAVIVIWSAINIIKEAWQIKYTNAIR